jgi:hypothetical protein
MPKKKPRKKPLVDAALHPVIQSPPERHIITERMRGVEHPADGTWSPEITSEASGDLAEDDDEPDEGPLTAEKAAALIPKEIG